jgi:hypothetical protein
LALTVAGSSYAELESGHVVSAEEPTELVDALRRFLFDESFGQREQGVEAAEESVHHAGNVDQTGARKAAVVRRFYEHVYAGDFDAVLAMLHADFR